MSPLRRFCARFVRRKAPRPVYRNAHRKNSDVFEYVKYAPALTALRQIAIPTIIGFRIKKDGPVPPSLTDPRPSFAILETDEEIAAWQKLFVSKISYETDMAAVDEELKLHSLVNFHKPGAKTYEVLSEKPLLKWNDRPSVLPDSPLCFSGTAFLPEVSDAGWPPLSVTMGPVNFDDQAARGRYGFEQPPLEI